VSPRTGLDVVRRGTVVPLSGIEILCADSITSHCNELAIG